MFKTEIPEIVEIRHRFVERGVLKAEINEFLFKLLQKDGYSGMSFRLHEKPVRLAIKLDKTENILKDGKVLLKQIRSLIAKRIGEEEDNVEVVVELVRNRGLCPAIQAENIRCKFLENVSYRRAVSSAIKSIMASGAQGCVIEVSGKFKGQRARSVKTIEGKVINAGHPREEFMRYAQSSVLVKQGIIGIKVGIMLPYDEEGIKGPAHEMVDKIKVLQVKDE